jgi:hypothetical protein
MGDVFENFLFVLSKSTRHDRYLTGLSFINISQIAFFPGSAVGIRLSGSSLATTTADQRRLHDHGANRPLGSSCLVVAFPAVDATVAMGAQQTTFNQPSCLLPAKGASRSEAWRHWAPGVSVTAVEHGALFGRPMGWWNFLSAATIHSRRNLRYHNHSRPNTGTNRQPSAHNLVHCFGRTSSFPTSLTHYDPQHVAPQDLRHRIRIDHTIRHGGAWKEGMWRLVGLVCERFKASTTKS